MNFLHLMLNIRYLLILLVSYDNYKCTWFNYNVYHAVGRLMIVETRNEIHIKLISTILHQDRTHPFLNLFPLLFPCPSPHPLPGSAFGPNESQSLTSPSSPSNLVQGEPAPGKILISKSHSDMNLQQFKILLSPNDMHFHRRSDKLKK